MSSVSVVKTDKIKVGAKVSLRAKVTQIGESIESSRDNNSSPRQPVRLADSSGNIHMTIFGKNVNQLERGQSYCFQTVKKTIFQGQISLILGDYSNFAPTEALTDVLEEETSGDEGNGYETPQPRILTGMGI